MQEPVIHFSCHQTLEFHLYFLYPLITHYYYCLRIWKIYCYIVIYDIHNKSFNTFKILHVV